MINPSFLYQNRTSPGKDVKSKRRPSPCKYKITYIKKLSYMTSVNFQLGQRYSMRGVQVGHAVYMTSCNFGSGQRSPQGQ